MKTLLLMVAMAAAVPFTFTACDRTVSESTKTTSGDGGTQTESKKVVEHPNGSVTETKEKSTNEAPQ